MKKYIIAAVLTISAIIVVACSDLFPDRVKSSKKYKIIDVQIAVSQGNQTKTIITPGDDNGLQSTWRPGDALYVYCDEEPAGKVLCVGGISTDEDGNSVAVFKGRISLPEDYLFRGHSDSKNGYEYKEEGYEGLAELTFFYPGSEDFITKTRQSYDAYEESSDPSQPYRYHQFGHYSRLDLEPVEDISQLKKYDLAMGLSVLEKNDEGVYAGTIAMRNLLSFLKISTLDMQEDIKLNSKNNGMIYLQSTERREYPDGTPYEEDYYYGDNEWINFLSFAPSHPITLPAGKEVLYIPVNMIIMDSGDMAYIYDEYLDEERWEERHNDPYSPREYSYVYLRGKDSDGNYWGIPRFKATVPGKLYMNADGSPIAIGRLTEGDLTMTTDFEDRWTNQYDFTLYQK